MPEQEEVHDVVEEEVQEERSVSEVEQEGGGGDSDSIREEAEAEVEALVEQARETVEKTELEELQASLVSNEDTTRGLLEVDKEATEEEIQQGLSALKYALMPPVEDDEPTLEEISPIHALQAEHGMAGSRNAVKIDKDRNEMKGQRPGMRIGQPTRHYLTANSPKVEKPLGKGAFKIDENRPINN